MLTKKHYLYYKQCPKLAWYYNQELNQLEPDKKLFNNLMAQLFDCDVKVPLLPGQYNRMMSITRNMIKKEEKLLNPSFIYKDIYVTFDCIEHNDEGYTVYLVKGATKVSERYQLELSYIKYVVEKVLKKPIRCKLVYVNKHFKKFGPILPALYFNIIDLTDDVELIKEKHMRRLGIMLNEERPEVSVGLHCDKGRVSIACPYKKMCFGEMKKDSIFNIAGMDKNVAYTLYHKGIQSMYDIEEHINLTHHQQLQIDSFRKKSIICEKEKIKDFLNTFKLPLYFLDFEAYRKVLPELDGSGPTTEIPFQYSLHILTNKLEHKEFIGQVGTDSRRALAEALLEDIPQGVQVVAYNMSYEKRMISYLASLFDDLSEDLQTLNGQLIDLEIPFKNKWYYTPGMQGKYSIKYVLPALYPNDPSLDYQNQVIRNGMMALDAYVRLSPSDLDLTDRLDELRSYCKLDTLAMVKIYEFLLKL